MAITDLCPHCRRGVMLARVCYDVCSHCGRPAALRPGCLRFRDLQIGDRFLAGYDPEGQAPVLIKGYPPMYVPESPTEIEPNAYAEDSAARRYIAFGPEALVWKVG